MALRADEFESLVFSHSSEIEAGKAYRQVVVTANGTTLTLGRDDEARGAYGVTKTQVKELQRALKRCGIALEFDDVDALLCEAVMTGRIDRWLEIYAAAAGISNEDPRTPAEKARDRMRRRRQRLKDALLCIICGVRPAVLRRDGTYGTTCRECGDVANQNKTTEGKQGLRDLREGQELADAFEHGQ